MSETSVSTCRAALELGNPCLKAPPTHSVAHPTPSLCNHPAVRVSDFPYRFFSRVVFPGGYSMQASFSLYSTMARQQQRNPSRHQAFRMKVATFSEYATFTFLKGSQRRLCAETFLRAKRQPARSATLMAPKMDPITVTLLTRYSCALASIHS